MRFFAFWQEWQLLSVSSFILNHCSISFNQTIERVESKELSRKKIEIHANQTRCKVKRMKLFTGFPSKPPFNDHDFSPKHRVSDSMAMIILSKWCTTLITQLFTTVFPRHPMMPRGCLDPTKSRKDNFLNSNYKNQKQSKGGEISSQFLTPLTAINRIATSLLPANLFA